MATVIPLLGFLPCSGVRAAGRDQVTNRHAVSTMSLVLGRYRADIDPVFLCHVWEIRGPPTLRLETQLPKARQDIGSLPQRVRDYFQQVRWA